MPAPRIPARGAVLALLALLALSPAAAPAAEAGDPPGAPARRGRQRPAKAGEAGPLAPVRPGPPLTPTPAALHATPGGRGTVIAVAAGRAYLDAGGLAGLAPGLRLQLARRGQAAGTCTVEAVSDHSATCTGGAARPGDTFALAPAAAAAAAPVQPLPAPVPAVENDRRRAALEAAPVALVEWTGSPEAGPTGPQRVEARLVHQTWTGSSVEARHQERLEVRVDGAELFPGWRLYLDGDALYRSYGPESRFMTGDSALLEVRELQVAARGLDRAVPLAIGRVRPWSAPGSTVFDGAQVGWRPGPGSELGVFGGLVPQPWDTAFTTDRATAGLYGSVEGGDEDRLLRGEGRVAYVKAPELKTRLEAEALVHGWFARTIDVSGQLRTGFGDVQAPSAIDGARIDVSARLGQPVWLSGGYRYVGLDLSDTGAPAFYAGPGHHADGSLAWEITPAVTVRASGGYAKDTVSQLDRAYLGPELLLPRLFGGSGGLAAGWLEETGWTTGRTFWLQAQGTPWAQLRLLARASYYMDERPALPTEETVGLLASLSYDVSRWFTFGLSGLGRMLVSPQEQDQPYGVNVMATLVGRY